MAISEKPINEECKQCLKKINPRNWVKCNGTYFCSLKCLHDFEKKK